MITFTRMRTSTSPACREGLAKPDTVTDSDSASTVTFDTYTAANLVHVPFLASQRTPQNWIHRPRLLTFPRRRASAPAVTQDRAACDDIGSDRKRYQCRISFLSFITPAAIASLSIGNVSTNLGF